jgi:hypothetical protein
VRDFVRRGFLPVERARSVLTRKAAETLNFQDRCHNFACFVEFKFWGSRTGGRLVGILVGRQNTIFVLFGCVVAQAIA